MGAFFGSVHVRHTDRETVRAVLAKLAKKLDCQFLLAPEINGWITVFPSGSGQDARVSRELARQLTGPVLHVLLHDSDVFDYSYYREGRLVDQFSSRPDYFHKVSSKQRQSLMGRPELLRDLLREPAHAEALQQLLGAQQSGDAFAAHTLIESFAQLLGLPNACNSYEYLQAGEAEDIEGWDEFIHIPDLSPVVAHRKAAEAAAEEEFRRLSERGLLLWDESPAPRSICSDPRANGFLALSGPDFEKESQLLLYRAPWQAGATPLGVTAGARAMDLCVSASGRYVAVGYAHVPSRADLWDLESKQILWEVHDTTSVLAAGFTADEKILITAGETIQMTSVENGRRLRTIPLSPYNHVVALHPAGSVLVALLGRCTLTVIDMQSGDPIRAFCLEYLDDLSAFQLMYRAVVTKVSAQAREDSVRSMERVATEAFGPHSFEAWKNVLGRESVTTEAPRRLLFSPDGEFLSLATDKAVWVFRWAMLLGSEEPAPKPLYRFSPRKDTSYAAIFANLDTKGMVHDMAYDMPRNLLLLGAGDGSIHQLDLTTGVQGVLLQMPDALPVGGLGISKDATVLYTILRPILKDVLRADHPPDRLKIWDYSKLVAER